MKWGINTIDGLALPLPRTPAWRLIMMGTNEVQDYPNQIFLSARFFFSSSDDRRHGGVGGGESALTATSFTGPWGVAGEDPYWRGMKGRGRRINWCCSISKKWNGRGGTGNEGKRPGRSRKGYPIWVWYSRERRSGWDNLRLSLWGRFSLIEGDELRSYEDWGRSLHLEGGDGWGRAGLGEEERWGEAAEAELKHLDEGVLAWWDPLDGVVLEGWMWTLGFKEALWLRLRVLLDGDDGDAVRGKNLYEKKRWR